MTSDITLYTGAIALGALHAFEPGHGKSLIAAYMIGTKGRAIDGILLGLIVTFTHTFSVIILGIIAKLMAGRFTDAQLHTWMGLASAILILAVGIWMLKERLGGNDGHTHLHFFCKDGHHHDHDHGHGHHHDHDHGHGHHHDHPHDHDHGHVHHHPAAGEKTDMWRLLLLGISGGLVPCPAAIATLLAAIGAGRTAKGLTMALFFSLGLGLVMMTIGVVLSRAGNLTRKFGDNRKLAHRLGILSAVVITLLGAYTLLHSIRGVLSM
jgi:nickel/cobalt exporter